jgi:hypothetical protein
VAVCQYSGGNWILNASTRLLFCLMALVVPHFKKFVEITASFCYYRA